MFFVGWEHRVHVPATPERPVRVLCCDGDALLVGDERVSRSSFDVEIGAGEDARFDTGVWLISRGQSRVLVGEVDVVAERLAALEAS